MANNSIVPTCIAPFVAEADYPPNGGDIAARFCATLPNPDGSYGSPPSISCCLPCPTTHYLFSSAFQSRVRLASYLSIGSLVCNVFLLVTFLVLPREKSHRHYLSIGLTSSLILVAIAFIIPLGTKPELCYDAITPHNEKTQASCAATGVLVELGGMGAVVWILLRSIWTTLRITVHLKNVNLFKNISIALGIGLPILFMAISVPITSVSYSLGHVCVPSHPNAFQTWFVWILIFTVLSWVILLGTIIYCLWRFASFSFTEPTHSVSTSVTSAEINEEGLTNAADDDTEGTPKRKSRSKRRRIAWARARGILKLQWRSIALAFIIANLGVYFGMFFIEQSGTSQFQYLADSIRIVPDDKNFDWIACLMANDGEREKCLGGATGFGLREVRVEATLIIASVIGIIVFLLMVRSSMFVGWWQLLRHPKRMFRRPSVDADTPFGGAGSGGVRIETPSPPVERPEDKHTPFEEHDSSEDLQATWDEHEQEERDEYERKRTSATLVGPGSGIAL